VRVRLVEGVVDGVVEGVVEGGRGWATRIFLAKISAR
jgi:hypothetical protein